MLLCVKINGIQVKISILDVIIILCWMGIVFTFSSQMGSVSTGLSGSIAEKVIDVVYKNDTNLTTKERAKLISKCNYIMRKLAHYTIFLIGGIAIISFVNRLSKKKGKSAIITILLGFLYACSDELHQYFVSGRDARFKDVLIDTAGVITGVVLYLLILTIARNIRNKKKNKLDIESKEKECI